MKPTIVFDMDGVLTDFVRGFTTLAAVVSGKPAYTAYSTGAQLSWDFPYTPEVVASTWRRIIASTEFWATLPPLITPWETEEIKALSQLYTVEYVTSRVGTNCLQQTQRWLSNNGLRGDVTVTDRKVEFISRLAPVAMIDDKPDVVTKALSSGLRCYIRDWPYNRELAGPRVSSVSEYIHRVKQLTTAEG